MYISFHILNTCGFLMHPEPTSTFPQRPVDPDRSRTSMVFIFKARSGMPLPRRRGHGDPGELMAFPMAWHRKLHRKWLGLGLKTAYLDMSWTKKTTNKIGSNNIFVAILKLEYGIHGRSKKCYLPTNFAVLTPNQKRSHPPKPWFRLKFLHISRG